ncbi:hypothetical protein [Hafnia paralvei]|uniref:hypothetical protein n=1 Tax=Hafnia paralvei TaxID=546367 RepID=UPI000BB56F9A|nr:hypothetical protein [Hafnia paralvei]MCE9950390.1 hypothetical protein [Hafnia paralvei]PNK66170.1 hypothetical protein A6J69_003515 [Hafnia paralvei]
MLSNIFFNEERQKKYRFEQMVFMKVNSVPINSTNTACDYTVNKVEDGFGNIYYNVKAEGQYIESQPDTHTAMMKMVNNVQLAMQKNITFLVSSETGNIQKIINHHELLDEWSRYRNDFLSEYDFVRSDENKGYIVSFLDENEKIINNEQMLIKTINAQLFFNLFFNRHLVKVDSKLYEYRQSFHSQLFSGHVCSLKMQSKIGRETREYIELLNKSELDEKSVNTDAILGLYNEKYQPIVRYPFSKYEAEYNTNIILHPESLLIQSAQIELSESVKNNLALVANGRLKEIQ